MRELERKGQLLLKKAEMDAKRVCDGGDDNASGISAGKVSAVPSPTFILVLIVSQLHLLVNLLTFFVSISLLLFHLS